MFQYCHFLSELACWPTNNIFDIKHGEKLRFWPGGQESSPLGRHPPARRRMIGFHASRMFPRMPKVLYQFELVVPACKSEENR